MYPHLGGTVAFWFVCLYYLSPEQTGGTEFGYFHKIVAADTKVEFNRFGGGIYVYAFVCHYIQILFAPSQCITELLHDIGSCIAQRYGVYVYHTILRQLLGFFHERHNVFDYEVEVVFRTFYQHSIDGVEVYRAFQLRQIVFVCLEIIDQNLGQLFCSLGTDIEVQFYRICLYAVEQVFDEPCREFVFLDPEAQRINSFFEYFQCLFVRFCTVFYYDFLTNKPIVVLLSASDVGELARSGIESLPAFYVFQTIERVNIETLGRFPNEFLRKIGTF